MRIVQLTWRHQTQFSWDTFAFRVIETGLILLFQKTFIPIVKGFISHKVESSSFENKWLRYPKIATNSKKKEMERLELLPWFMNIQKDKWTLGFQKCIFYRHFRVWTGKIVWKFSINFKSTLFILFLARSKSFFPTISFGQGPFPF